MNNPALTRTRFNYPTEIQYGPGARKDIAKTLKARGYKKPMIVTDKGLAALPLIAEFQEIFKAEGIPAGLYSGVYGNPVKSQVTAGAQAARNFGADAIVAIGGGAALDVAKVIALMMFHPGDLFDYEDDKPGARSVDQKLPFIVAVPTTAGTGSEVGRSAVVSDDQTHVKKIIFSPRFMPGIVYADPEVTLQLPPSMTAATGMDALIHLVESYLAKGFHPIADGIALEGIRIINQSLLKAVQAAKKPASTPAQLEARGQMMCAAMMGAMAFQKGLGLVHSCAHALSTVCDLHHGTANGIMAPYALAHNLPVVKERFQTMESVIGLKSKDGKAFLKWVAALQKKAGLPTTLKAAGVKPEDLEKLVAIAVKDVCHPLSPKTVTQADFERIFAWAYEGKPPKKGAKKGKKPAKKKKR